MSLRRGRSAGPFRGSTARRRAVASYPLRRIVDQAYRQTRLVHGWPYDVIARLSPADMVDLPARLWPGHACELPHYDEDWFRFYYLPPATSDKAVASNRVVCYEVHELGCRRGVCQYRPEPCPFHCDGCACSLGACQEGS